MKKDTKNSPAANKAKPGAKDSKGSAVAVKEAPADKKKKK
jgi:hypothetical protein